jgi:hypothetical protein
MARYNGSLGMRRWYAAQQAEKHRLEYQGSNDPYADADNFADDPSAVAPDLNNSDPAYLQNYNTVTETFGAQTAYTLDSTSNLVNVTLATV